MKFYYLLILFCCCTLAVRAQGVSTYQLYGRGTSINCVGTPITVGIFSGQQDDAFRGGIDMGFVFPYGGQVFTRIGVSVDGFVVLGAPANAQYGGPGQGYISATDPTGAILSNPQAAHNTIAVCNRNWDMGRSGSVFMERHQGCTPGSNGISITWRNLRTEGSPDSLDLTLRILERGDIYVIAERPLYFRAPSRLPAQIGLIGADTSDHHVIGGSTQAGFLLVLGVNTRRSDRRGIVLLSQDISRNFSSYQFNPTIFGNGRLVKPLGVEINAGYPPGCGTRSDFEPFRVRVTNTGIRATDTVILQHSVIIASQPSGNVRTAYPSVRQTVRLPQTLGPGDTAWVFAPLGANLAYHGFGGRIVFGTSSPGQVPDRFADSVRVPLFGTRASLFFNDLPYNRLFDFDNRIGAGLRGDRPYRNAQGAWDFDRGSGRWVGFGMWSDSVPYVELPCMDLSWATGQDSIVLEARFVPFTKYPVHLSVMGSTDGGQNYREIYGFAPPVNRDSLWVQLRADISELAGSPRPASPCGETLPAPP